VPVRQHIASELIDSAYMAGLEWPRPRKFSAGFEGNGASLCGLDATQPYRDDFLCSKGLNKGGKILIIGPEFSRSITPYVNREIQP